MDESISTCFRKIVFSEAAEKLFIQFLSRKKVYEVFSKWSELLDLLLLFGFELGEIDDEHHLASRFALALKSPGAGAREETYILLHSCLAPVVGHHVPGRHNDAKVIFVSQKLKL